MDSTTTITWLPEADDDDARIAASAVAAPGASVSSIGEVACTVGVLPDGIYTAVGDGDSLYVKGPFGYNPTLAEDVTWASEGDATVSLIVIEAGVAVLVPADKVTIPPGDGGFGAQLVKEELQRGIVAAIVMAEGFPEDAAEHYRHALIGALALLEREWNPVTKVVDHRPLSPIE